MLGEDFGLIGYADEEIPYQFGRRRLRGGECEHERPAIVGEVKLCWRGDAR